jgi:hypothetical protein
LAELRGICKSIQDGHTSWSEYAREPEAQEKASVSDDGLKEAQAQLLEKKKLQGESSGSEGEESSILSFSEAKSMLNIAESAKEIGDVMNRFLAGETTAAQRKEIMSMKDAAVTRLAKHAAGKK